MGYNLINRNIDDFLGREVVILREDTRGYPMWLRFPNAAEAEGPGGIPFGDSIVGAEAKVIDPDQEDQTLNMLVDPGGTAQVVDGNTVKVSLSNYAQSKTGMYTLKVILTLASGAVLGYDAKRFYVV